MITGEADQLGLLLYSVVLPRRINLHSSFEPRPPYAQRALHARARNCICMLRHMSFATRPEAEEAVT